MVEIYLNGALTNNAIFSCHNCESFDDKFPIFKPHMGQIQNTPCFRNMFL